MKQRHVTAEAASNTSHPSRRSTPRTRPATSNPISLDPIVPEAEISIEFLQTLLADVKVDSLIDNDGDIVIREAFGPVIWVSLIPDRRWVQIGSKVDVPAVANDSRLEFVNWLNGTFAMGQFTANEETVAVNYFMTYGGGLIPDQFIHMLQRFGSLVHAAVKKSQEFSVESQNGADRCLN